MTRLSSGTIRPPDNPAGLAISEMMRAQTSGVNMAQRNMTSQISMHQTAQSFGQSIGSNLTRMRDITIQAGGITNASDRQVLEEEFKMLQDDVAMITSNDSALGQFNGTKLFQGDKLSVQSGPDLGQTTDIEMSDLQITSSTSAGGISFGEVIDSVNGLQMMDSTALESLDAAIDINSGSRVSNAINERTAGLRLEGLRDFENNLQSSESSIRNVDFAKESVNIAKLLIQNKVNNALYAQGNDLSSFGILKLL